jgi:uncharacterized protein
MFKHYLLFYEVSEDYVAGRAAFREAHLEKGWRSHERGELVLGGALANPLDGAVLLFEGDSPQVAEAFARADPYVTSGLVKRWYVREWSTVVGEGSSTPLRTSAMAADKKHPAHPLERLASLGRVGLILRMWRARSTVEKEDAYVQHVTEKVFPSLGRIEGHRGASLLRRRVDGAIEVVVLTLWETMDAIRRFAGSEPERAVIEPEARAALTEFDDFVAHFEVVHSTANIERPRDPGA